MKKMTFALACASAAALFADMAPLADFEKYTLGDAVADAVEPDTTLTYWLYGAASGSADGSKVAGDSSAKFLELSTEGGTLWRSINEGNTAGETIDAKLGAAQAVPATGLYVDTMVQFTPTEDGGAPELGGDDKLAIWLNVTAGEDGAPSTTNLCVRAQFLNYADDVVSKAATFTLEPVEGTLALDDASAWHRLTVKAYTLLDDENQRVSAFEIKVDDKAMKAKTSPIGAGMQEMWAEILSAEQKSLVEADRLFPSLEGIAAAGSTFTLQAVGFKGSGAIDDLSISTTAPSPEGDVDWEHPMKETGTAAEMFGITREDLAGVDGEKLAAWALDNEVTFAADAASIIKDAFLLNCANDADAVAEAADEFKITSITVNDDGSVSVTTPADKNYNGTVEIVGSATIDGEYTAAAVTNKTAKFVKAILK
ncbi:MAG: hypothetical protein Q4G65_16590 [bacterium]|nr:hypothetical protein [bacterium]